MSILRGFLGANFLRLGSYRLGAARFEFLNASCGIDKLLFASVEGMAVGADFNANFLLGGPGGEGMSARANHFGVWEVCRMESVFHEA